MAGLLRAGEPACKLASEASSEAGEQTSRAGSASLIVSSTGLWMSTNDWLANDRPASLEERSWAAGSRGHGSRPSPGDASHRPEEFDLSHRPLAEEPDFSHRPEEPDSDFSHSPKLAISAAVQAAAAVAGGGGKEAADVPPLRRRVELAPGVGAAAGRRLGARADATRGAQGRFTGRSLTPSHLSFTQSHSHKRTNTNSKRFYSLSSSVISSRIRARDTGPGDTGPAQLLGSCGNEAPASRAHGLPQALQRSAWHCQPSWTSESVVDSVVETGCATVRCLQARERWQAARCGEMTRRGGCW
jgi:hypothetical protein